MALCREPVARQAKLNLDSVTPPANPLVSFRNVFYRLGRQDILRNLSFDVEAGETLVLLGRSGSGKTTVLKLVNGLLLPSEGEVLVEGRPTTAWNSIRLNATPGSCLAANASGSVSPVR